MIATEQYSNHKIGLYIRVSTEEQAANPEGSIKNQEQRLRQHVSAGKGFGEIFDVYIDRAKSGKDTKRAALQKLLHDIEDKKVNLVVVTEMSRLSRSVKDFTHIWELMNKMGCGFLSLREKFDTTTAAGEMLLLNIASFSQFERRQVSERVAANFLARSKRGLFNGGTVPIGYKQIPEKKGYLVVDEDERNIVTTCFEMFLKKENLLGSAKSLNELGIRLPKIRKGAGGCPRDGRFTISNLSTILKNEGYLGIKVYKENDETKRVPACWPAILDEKLFYKVQNILDRNRTLKLKIQANGKRHPYILSSLVYCGQCGDKLPGKSAHGATKKMTYYEHVSALKLASRSKKCTPHRVQTRVLEPLVWNKLIELITSLDVSRSLFAEMKKQQKDDPHKAEISGLKSNISLLKRKQSSLVSHLSQIPAGISAAPFYEQMKDLQYQTEEAQKQLEFVIEDQGSREALSYQDYAKFLTRLGDMVQEELPCEEKAKIARLLLLKVEIFADHAKLFLNLDTSMKNDLRFFDARSCADVRKTHHVTNIDREKKRTSTEKKFLGNSSFCLTNGDP